MSWGDYFQRVGNKPNSLVVSLLRDYPINRGVALDLGAGNLRDAQYLLSQGFKKVTAVDSSPLSQNFVTEGIELQQCPIQEFRVDSCSVDFAISCNTLFFLNKREVEKVFKSVHQSLVPQGYFTCNVLAPKDGWVVDQGRRDVHPFIKKEVLAFCKMYSQFEIGELLTQGSDASGYPKLWHQWSIVVRK